MLVAYLCAMAVTAVVAGMEVWRGDRRWFGLAGAAVLAVVGVAWRLRRPRHSTGRGDRPDHAGR